MATHRMLHVSITLGVLFLSMFELFVCQDVEVSDDNGEEGGNGEAQGESDDGDEEQAVPNTEAPADPAKSAAAIADQGHDVLNKLSQLKQLLSQKGDKVSEKDLETLKNLESMLGDTLNSLTTQKTPEDAEVLKFFSACVSMSVARVGGQRPTTQWALRQMADGKGDLKWASETELWRLAVSCVNRLTDSEYLRFNAGTLKQLPREYADIASKPEMKDEVVNLDPGHFAQLRIAAKAIVPDAPPPPTAPSWYGYLAILPVVGVFGFLAKKIIDMQMSETPKKGKKEKKQK
eukprot:TRINITY_DN56650_c0_g1_i1.p1 TRINITY_DN56650_c0_g1~~TRINITY_DN56650_c0_g1_i1.p1  ORF type:complete len:337 (-),score=63.53 TRINITY_DN56650_c0_g1_i1:243-1112(-)